MFLIARYERPNVSAERQCVLALEFPESGHGQDLQEKRRHGISLARTVRQGAVRDVRIRHRQ